MAGPSKATTGDTQTGMKKIAKEVTSLEPSALITLYEIDVSDLQATLNLGTGPIEQSVLRFHNMEVLNQTTIAFRGQAYHPVPIMTDGFEMKSDGSLPRPTLTFVSLKAIDDLASNNQFASLKRALLELNNMIGAKVIRIRTFAKFLDASGNDFIKEAGQFTESTNPEFPRDLYYIERKIAEDKNTMQFELASTMDMENFKLPGRLCLANRCPWTYRGEGCCYEFKATSLTAASGQKDTFGATGHLPNFAPPIANDEDELLTGILTGSNKQAFYNPYTVSASAPTQYDFDKAGGYTQGSVVYVTKNGIKFYYVAKLGGVPAQTGPPPNSSYWEADQCSKTLQGCKLRWGKNGAAKNGSTPSISNDPANKFLPFGGFPGTNTKSTIQ
jgi:lambda family phage minor tail protein L